MIYPEAITKRLATIHPLPSVAGTNGQGAAANFTCGSFVRFLLQIEDGVVSGARFESNGCGYMLATADMLVKRIEGRHLTDLHGLADEDMRAEIQSELGKLPGDRDACAAACIEALRAVFADYRATQVAEFSGEKALICTCFGVTEETIEDQIAKRGLHTVEAVTTACNAGGGCGSCRMLIQEIIDSHV